MIYRNLLTNSIVGKGTLGYDCIMIPGAKLGTMCADFSANAINANRFCGNSQGLAKSVDAVDNTKQGTICSKNGTKYIHKHIQSSTKKSTII